jgi:hypothetical protein
LCKLHILSTSPCGNGPMVPIEQKAG